MTFSLMLACAIASGALSFSAAKKENKLSPKNTI